MTVATAPDVGPAPGVGHARGWHAATAAIAWASVALQLFYSAVGEPGDGLTMGVRVFRFFSYFTILSNIVVAGVTTALALNPARNGRVFRVLRLDSLVMITVTGLIYAFVLAGLYEVVGVGRNLANDGLHYVTPTLTVLAFLVVGPRLRWRVPEVFGALVLPLIWVAYILAQGAVTHWYPYPFMDVNDLGYAMVFANIAGIVLVGVVFGFVFFGVDRGLLRLRRGPADVATGAGAAPGSTGADEVQDLDEEGERV